MAQGGEGDTGQVVEGMGIVLHQDDDDGGDNEVPRGRRKSSKEETAERLKLAVAEYRDVSTFKRQMGIQKQQIRR